MPVRGLMVTVAVEDTPAASVTVYRNLSVAICPDGRMNAPFGS